MKRMELKTHGEAAATAISIGAGALEEAGRAAAHSPTGLRVTDESWAEARWS